MQIKLGLAKAAKNGAAVAGDAFLAAERPRGGLTAILASGQGDGASARAVADTVVLQTAALIGKGERDEKISAAVHDFLYELSAKRTPCTLSLVSVDTENDSLLISRNATSPVIVKTADFAAVYDDAANPIGLAKHAKPDLVELPITGETIAVTFTDGILTMGKKNGRAFSTDRITEIIDKSAANDTAFIAQNIAEYAISLDKEEASADFTVAVLAVTDEEKTVRHFDMLTVEQRY